MDYRNFGNFLIFHENKGSWTKMTYNIEPSALRGLCMVWGIIPWMKMKDNPFGGLGGDVLTNLDN